MSARRPDLYNKRQVNGGISEAKAGMTQGNTKIIMMVICGMAVLMMLMFKDSGKSVQTRGDCPTMGQLRSQVLVKASQDIFFDTFDAINHTDRIRAVGQPGATLWMTGLSGSGKSTIGKALERRLVLDDSVHMYRLDGDNLRFGLSKDLRLSAEDRAEAVRRAYEVSLMMADSGTLSLVSLISPYRKDRDTAREVHERLRIPFIEVFVKVDISVAEERDPKGLYKKVREGKIKGMTGIDAPYEKPLKPEITLNTGTCCENTAAEERLKTCKSEAKNLPVKTKFQDHCPPILEQCINACVDQLRDELIAKKVINTNKKSPQQIGAPVDCPKAAETNKHHEKQPGEEAMGHADGYPDGTTPPNVIEENEEFWKSDTVTILQPVTIRDVDVQWVQVIGEGWAAPLKGPMRESALVQALHFNSMLVDPSGDNGGGSSGHGPGPAGTDFGDSKGAARMVHNGERVSMPVPIAIPVSSHTKMLINRAQKKGGKVQLVLVSPAGEPVAILDDPEVYAFRKEEMITRSWGSWDLHHPYIKENIIEAGEYLLGGELSKVRRIKYNDGLDQWRLTPEELIRKFKEKGADGVFAFQTRNPTHAGHAHLMKDGRKQLLEKGYRNPVLWLSPLGGWTKSDDVPLDIRVKQHQAVLDEGMLDKAWTVLAIWPSPMVYSGPTEVQWHAKSRRVAGADYFIVGRDPAGLSYSDEYAQAHNQKKGDDVYEPDHGRYVLQVSPGMGKLGLLASGAVHYDKTDGEMKPKPAGITKDEFNNRFLKISGSKMRQMGRMMVDVCDSIEAIPATWSEDPKCVPPKFMVPSGWKIMREYYKSKDEPLVKANAVLQSKQIPTIAKQAKMVNATKVGLPGELFAVYLTNEAGATISPWHDVPLKTGEHFNMVVEFPKGTNSKFEVQKELPFNPIKQDVKNKVPRHYTYGMSFFNNGLFPQTWEDGSLRDEEGNLGDNDPLDVMEVIAISLEDPDSSRINDIASLKAIKGDALVDRIVNWLRFYKTTDKKTPDEASPNTFLKNAEYQSVTETLKVIEHTNQRWSMLRAGTADKTDKTQHFWLKE